MSKVFDEDLGCWICFNCKKPFDSECPLCKGSGDYLLKPWLVNLVDCNCCGCLVDFSI